MRKFNLFLKRIIDILGSIFGLILTSPLLLIIALSIKFTSEGPIFFHQERLGKDGKVFIILKYRTMVVNAEKMGTGLFIEPENDSRITKVGHFLRSTSLDELPQLWNVLIGKMSLVGPRPPVPYYPYKYEEYSDLQRMRFDVKPGITGLSQVTVRNSVSWDEGIVYDIEYVRNLNVWIDIKIMFKTLRTLIYRENIYGKSRFDNWRN
ncbi:Putative colanic biosynthesis UDP-glucose lipid carrier transferase [Solibacillus isronensis B3W22]|uniref:Putative colanic biosynthesis UDP-glucose lipid carrier transferase n=1 Tax=Solibacillus isronensis B3W22 TaxID=1224748 RepID=K1KWA2_9BACL|nr:sugar transferase [Solibacillus isronensis]AMO84779.1 sugar transferase [Solibacillus silvestris]EKB46781.1 Putative colanic biosynthesis UDP-glucose lipid carrier transferase [Solibacillus isronensis B3W22]